MSALDQKQKDSIFKNRDTREASLRASSALSPDSLYLLHPCSRALSRHTTAMDGGSVDNAGRNYRPLHPWR
jgi:hypothetical protein